jgi:hypothetical protein
MLAEVGCKKEKDKNKKCQDKQNHEKKNRKKAKVSNLLF